MSDKNSTTGGLGILGVLQTIFIVLKLVHVIDWSWVVVFIPTFIGLGLTMLVIGVVLLVLYLNNRV